MLLKRPSFANTGVKKSELSIIGSIAGVKAEFRIKVLFPDMWWPAQKLTLENPAYVQIRYLL